ncbi:pseudouridine synthase [Undibacterium danionis]|uniref:Pseudouridine synthase n=1 Tax=Undibacterium danionis TaxID=1812100 RepID=A0ABV6IB57_9BURK
MQERPKSPLPTRHGISPSYIWLPEGAWDDALTFLCQQFPDIHKTRWLQRFEKQEIRASNGDILHPNSAVKRGMCIYYYREIEDEKTIPFQEKILFQDEHLLVADKPHFLAVTPGGDYLRETLLVRLKQKTGNEELSPLHRLDRETAGVILFSKQCKSRGAYQQLFQQRHIDKIYHAVAPHLPKIIFPLHKASRMVESERFFLMQEVPGIINSETDIDILERRDELTLYELRPSTGKKHQLRVHMASLGIPIINDNFYPTSLPSGSDDFNHPLQLLAKSIAFTDPITGEKRVFHSEQNL